MKKRDKIKVYADTSVFGGVFDEKFAEASSLFFKQVKQGRFQLIISDVVRREMEDAPKQVRDLFEEMTAISKIADLNAPALKLRQAYLDAKMMVQRCPSCCDRNDIILPGYRELEFPAYRSL